MHTKTLSGKHEVNLSLVRLNGRYEDNIQKALKEVQLKCVH